ncbi:hypothetical protein ACQEVZ_02440 [Dactylosporangium sp. CA-152071]|uniref:hypothetical protein n=1 Tax=Dactylosporangium sp. CA-152071 TaxID=3239933 RepID=UPI003D8AF8DE
MIAAETLGIPHTPVVVLAAGTFGRPAGTGPRGHLFPGSQTTAMVATSPTY